ncbi:MAG: carbohydrate kinase family protein [Clostridia bacterium]|nr:carbohydrate kinase family protein [Clostridia bacterium]
MSDKKKILVIGGADMALVANMYKIPDSGERISDDGGVAYVPGGDGISYSISLAAMGADAAIVSKLGADVHGQKLYRFCKDGGVDTSYLKVDHDHQTGFTLIIRDGEGEDHTVIYPGANAFVTNDALLTAFSVEADAVYIGLDLPFSTVLAAARIAADRGLPIFMEGSLSGKDYELENLPEIEVFSVNEAEALGYTGIQPGSMESSLRVSLAIGRRVKCKNVVIKQGARGAFVYDGKRYNTVPAYRSASVQIQGAARYAFASAMILEYLYSGDIRGAVKYGCAAGSIARARAGALNTPSLAEVEELVFSQQK